jgi:signal peptidase I
MSRNRIVISVTVTAILLAAIVILRAFIFEFLIISGDSMNPTLAHGDRILVHKLAYRSREPDIGDIVAFRIGLKTIVKRVASVPGDVVEVRNGQLYCNDKVFTHDLYSHNPHRRSYGPIEVRSRHVFVVGDNTALSMDSRDFGTIPYQGIIGKAVFRYFPPKRMGGLDRSWKERGT